MKYFAEYYYITTNATLNILSSCLWWMWILFYAYYCCMHEYYCGLTPFLLFYFSECLRGWLDYPGHSVLFSRPLRGVSWDFSRGHPLGISFQVHFVASLELTDGPVSSDSLVDTRLAFLFKTYRGVTWRPTGISFQDLSRHRLSWWAVYLA